MKKIDPRLLQAFVAVAREGSVSRGAQRLFLKIRFLHQPMRQTAQQFALRAATFIAARPQPDMVGIELRHAAFFDAI